MAVDLTHLSFRRVELAPLRLGGVIRGVLGGSQRIDRKGDRWQASVETAPMPIEPQGRILSALLERAQREGALIRIRQPDLRSRPFGLPVVATTTAAGKTLPVAGFQPGVEVPLGWYVSIVVAGQRYFDKIDAPVIAAADGTATLTLSHLLRVSVPAGATVEMAARMQGSIEGDTGGAWEPNRRTSFAFTVIEDE